MDNLRIKREALTRIRKRFPESSQEKAGKRSLKRKLV